MARQTPFLGQLRRPGAAAIDRTVDGKSVGTADIALVYRFDPTEQEETR